VSPDLPRVIPQLGGPAFIIRRLECIEIRLEGRFRVDNYVSIEGKPDNHVRSQPAVFTDQARLFVKVAVVRHAGDLDDSF
jgi:hypothetical protein